MNRVCKKCNEEKNLSEFNFKKKWKIHTCRKCQHANSNQIKRNNKIKAVEYKGGKCIDCDYVGNVAVYDFHHLDSKEKDYKPNQLMGYSWETIKKELDKCVLLCANCHRIRHSEEK